MKIIELTRNKVAIVDDKDYEYLCQYNWCAYISNPKSENKRFYAVRGRKKADQSGPFMVRMHRVILGVDCDTDIDVDHINGDTLDNTRKNLRVCSRSENFYNKGKKKENGKSSSKFKGVWWNKHAKKWQAAIWYNKERFDLGYFDDEVKAAESYDKKALELHREFAKPNF